MVLFICSHSFCLCRSPIQYPFKELHSSSKKEKEGKKMKTEWFCVVLSHDKKCFLKSHCFLLRVIYLIFRVLQMLCKCKLPCRKITFVSWFNSAVPFFAGSIQWNRASSCHTTRFRSKVWAVWLLSWSTVTLTSIMSMSQTTWQR